jgi:hypothetical protein
MASSRRGFRVYPYPRRRYRSETVMRIRSDLFLIASCLFASLYAFGAIQDDSWQNLKHVTRERYYTVFDRKSNCVTGHIVKANDREISLKLPDATTATFDRANVLRVSVSQAAPYFPPRVRADVDRVRDIIYNNKSSWDDLKEQAQIEKIGRPGQEVKVVKTDGNKDITRTRSNRRKTHNRERGSGPGLLPPLQALDR